MASSKHGVKAIEWAKHLRRRHGTKRPQERLVRKDAAEQIKEEIQCLTKSE